MFKVRIHKNEKPLFAKQISFYCESLFNWIKDELLFIQKNKNIFKHQSTTIHNKNIIK